MDESSNLAEPFRCITAFVLPDAAKLEAMAEFAAGAGHEINNPLATIIGRVQLLLKDERDPQRRQMLLSIGTQAYRIRDMIGDAMLFGRPPAPELADVDLANAVSNICFKHADEFSKVDCQVTLDIPREIVLRADSVQLAIVISEIFRNARQAGATAIVVRALLKNKSAAIQLEDNGRGFTDLELQHAFDPFFSGRQAGRGLGFGLSKCWRIVQQHNGQIQIESTSHGRTLVEITWPHVNHHPGQP